jgi:hypothetical protein
MSLFLFASVRHVCIIQYSTVLSQRSPLFTIDLVMVYLNIAMMSLLDSLSQIKRCLLCLTYIVVKVILGIRERQGFTSSPAPPKRHFDKERNDKISLKRPIRGSDKNL